MKRLLLPTCFGALRWSTVLGVPWTELAVTKITLDLEGVSHISTTRRLTHFFIWLLKIMMSGERTNKICLTRVTTCPHLWEG